MAKSNTTGDPDRSVIATGLCFAEGPRWHANALWVSDMHANRVLRLEPDAAGGSARIETIAEVEGQPSGLGWLPDGRLLVVSMTDRRLLRLDPDGLTEHADLSGLAGYHCNDMVVDRTGRAYVGNFGFDLHNGAPRKPAELICVEPDGEARVVADDLMFPNGAVITADHRTLIVAESFARRLSAFDLLDNGDLANRRVWAELPDGAVPDGICLDSDGGVWIASPTTSDCLRQREGGEVTHRLTFDHGAYACMLSDDTLYVLTAGSSDPDTCRRNRDGQITAVAAPFPRAGWP